MLHVKERLVEQLSDVVVMQRVDDAAAAAFMSSLLRLAVFEVDASIEAVPSDRLARAHRRSSAPSQPTKRMHSAYRRYG